MTTILELPSSDRDANSVGGEFTAVTSGGPNYAANYSSKATASVTVNGKTETGFETFCVEFNQAFSPGTSYNTSVGPSIVNSSGSTALTVGAAWLYSQFAQGILSGYCWSSTSSYANANNRAYTADELQDAIWYLQGDISNGYEAKTSELYKFNSSTDPFLLLAEQTFGGTLSGAEKSDTAKGESNYGVEILTLTSIVNGCTVYNQDQLVYCPVPEPATFAAGAVLLAPLGFSALRRFRKGQNKLSAN